MRISKKLASLGVESRRKCEEIVLSGRVKVNNQFVFDLGRQIQDTDIIEMDNIVLKNENLKPNLYAFYKPTGCLTSNNDPQKRKLVYDFLPRNIERVFSIGRLDYNTEGLLLFTNSGDLKRFMELPSSGIERVYKVRVFGNLNLEKLKNLKNGITIQGINYGKFLTKVISSSGSNSWIEVRIYEGKNREIRKVFEFIGLTVNRLIRLQYGPYFLGDMKLCEFKKIKIID